MSLPHSKLRRSWGARLIGSALGAGTGGLLFFSLLGLPLENASYDLPFLFFREAGQRDDVIIVELNDDSYEVLQQNPSAFDGALHAKLIDRLSTAGAGVIVFDILFADQNPAPPGDTPFATAMRKHGRVVIAGDVRETTVQGAKIRSPVLIRPALAEAAAGWGIARIDASESARRHYPGTDQYPSLAWRAAEIAGAPVTRRPETRTEGRWLNYYGPDPFRRVPFHRALQSTNAEDFSFTGKTVFVGRSEEVGYAGEQKDQRRYPWTPLNGRLPFGIEFHALAFSNLIHGDALRRYPAVLELAVLLVIGGALGFWLPGTRPLPALGVALAAGTAVAAWGCLSQLLGRHWFGWLIPVAVQIPVVLAWAILFHALRAYLETEFLKRSLAFYLSPHHVTEILRQPELLKPGVAQREVSILFSDIAQFSKIAERMLPDDLANLLNEYYETAITAVHENGGTVMNLIGDAILAIWNAPQSQPDHEERACRAAVQLSNRLVEFDTRQRSLRLHTRVGVHSGPASVGNIGSSTHFEYTVIGENVNLASRLEGLNKHLGTSVLATRQIQKSVADKLLSRCVGHFRFKGFDQVVEVHELLLNQTAPAEANPWLAEFAQALHCFQRLEFDAAEKHFAAVCHRNPNDGPSAFYLKRIARLRVEPPMSGWMGEIDLDDK